MAETALDRVADQLRKYPHIRYKRSAAAITVPPTDGNGYPVTFTVDAGLYTVTLGGWHDDFIDLSQALNHFAMGLFDNVRLKTWAAGDCEYKWAIEGKQGDEWVPIAEEVGRVLFPFWRRRRVEYRRNRYIAGSVKPLRATRAQKTTKGAR